jgi:hypothetical protein
MAVQCVLILVSSDSSSDSFQHKSKPCRKCRRYRGELESGVVTVIARGRIRLKA